MAPGLTEREQRVVSLTAEGYTRWKIAELMGLSDSTVRDTIKVLCERYQCSQRELPDKVREEKDG